MSEIHRGSGPFELSMQRVCTSSAQKVLYKGVFLITPDGKCRTRTARLHKRGARSGMSEIHRGSGPFALRKVRSEERRCQPHGGGVGHCGDRDVPVTGGASDGAGISQEI